MCNKDKGSSSGVLLNVPLLPVMKMSVFPDTLWGQAAGPVKTAAQTGPHVGADRGRWPLRHKLIGWGLSPGSDSSSLSVLGIEIMAPINQLSPVQARTHTHSHTHKVIDVHKNEAHVQVHHTGICSPNVQVASNLFFLIFSIFSHQFSFLLYLFRNSSLFIFSAPSIIHHLVFRSSFVLCLYFFIVFSIHPLSHFSCMPWTSSPPSFVPSSIRRFPYRCNHHSSDYSWNLSSNTERI